jgi:5S rRNA maturation endonuclease (ribonuclease M5)
MGNASDRDEAWSAFRELWELLLTESATPGTTIVVEGDRDRRALLRLGVTGRIVPLHSGQRLGRVAKELAETADRVILLTDWDTEGGHLAQKLREFLEAGPTEVDSDFRRRLARALHGELVHVEGLHGWARRMAERQGAPLEYFQPEAPP